MKIQNTILQVILCGLICSSNLNAQYDSGTVIYSETGSANLKAVLNSNYKVFDFNGDNYVDVVAVKSDSTQNINQLLWYKGDGSGNFPQQSILLNFEYVPWGYDLRRNEIFYADMNEDGINDIVFQNSHTGFTTLLNNGQGNISEQITNEVVAQEFVTVDLKELADIDGDGDMDGVFFARQEDNGHFWSWYKGHCLIGYNDGNGNFNNYINIDDTIPEIFVHIETVDIDGDGDLDIICSGNKEVGTAGAGGESPIIYINPFIRVYKNSGANTFTTQQEIAIPTIADEEPMFTYIQVQDINADGKDELMIEYAILDNCIDDLHFHDCNFFYQFHILDYNVPNREFTTLDTYNSWLHGYGMNEYFNRPPEIYDEAFLIQFAHQNEDKNLDILSVNVPQGKIQWNIGDGKGGFDVDQSQVIHTNSEYSSNIPALRLSDVDNDSDLDVFVLLNTDATSTLTVFKNETPVSTGNNNFVLGKMGITPNLVSGNSYIKLTLPQNQYLSKATYNLFTIEGVKLITDNIEESRIFINDLPTGVYIIDVNLNGKNYINKLVVN